MDCCSVRDGMLQKCARRIEPKVRSPRTNCAPLTDLGWLRYYTLPSCSPPPPLIPAHLSGMTERRKWGDKRCIPGICVLPLYIQIYY